MIWITYKNKFVIYVKIIFNKNFQWRLIMILLYDYLKFYNYIMFDEKKRLLEQVMKDLPLTDDEILTFPKP